MDDDLVLTPHSRVHDQLAFLQGHPEVDLCGIQMCELPAVVGPERKARRFEAVRMGRPLLVPAGTRVGGRVVVGKASNCFLARTESVRRVGWDPNIRMIDHHEFFWRAAGQIVCVHDPHAYVYHCRNPFDWRYRPYRGDYEGDLAYIRAKRAAEAGESREGVCDPERRDATDQARSDADRARGIGERGRDGAASRGESPSDTKEALLVAYLCGCAVRGEIPQTSGLVDEDVDALVSFAARHSLDGCVAMALESAGLRTPASTETRGHAVYRAGALAIDEGEVLAGLEEAGVRYCPVKGSVLEGCYPRIGMRQMSDRDIFIDPARADDVRRVMEGLGFETVAFGTGDADVYHKPPVSNFEMHRRLLSRDERIGEVVVAYYDGVWDRLSKDEGNGCGWHMDVTEHYLYMVCHEYKHYAGNGTGLRSLLDVYAWLMRHGAEIDWDRAVRTAHALGIGEFEEENRRLALNLFGGAELDDGQLAMLERFASAGTYGNSSGRVTNGLDRHGDGVLGRAAYMWWRVFPPVDSMIPPGSFWEAHRWIVPLRYCSRIVCGLATKPGISARRASLRPGLSRRGVTQPTQSRRSLKDGMAMRNRHIRVS